VVLMRVRDFDRSGEVWEYRPLFHKTEKRGHDRVVLLGPACQAALAPWLSEGDPDAFLWSPKNAEEERHARRPLARRTPRWRSHVQRNTNQRVGKRKRPLGQRYTPSSVAQGIRMGIQCADRAERQNVNPKDRRLVVPAGERLVPNWHCHQPRHACATRLPREAGLDRPGSYHRRHDDRLRRTGLALRERGHEAHRLSLPRSKPSESTRSFSSRLFGLGVPGLVVVQDVQQALRLSRSPPSAQVRPADALRRPAHLLRGHLRIPPRSRIGCTATKARANRHNARGRFSET
jgi:hypothetical protein